MSYCSMQFMVHKFDDTEEQAEELKKTLSAFGVKVEFKTSGEDNFLFFSYEDDKVREKVTRKAGRKKNYQVNLMGLTWGQVKEAKENLNTKELKQYALDMGMSLQTFYRHYNEYLANEYSEDSEKFY